MSHLDFSILGPLRVRRLPSGDVVELADKPELLLARLLLAPGTPVSPDRLIDDVWDGAAKSNTVQQTVARLRERLGDDTKPWRTITLNGAGYAFAGPRRTIDAQRFALLARRGRDLVSTRPHAARAMLAEALESWHGPLLDGRGGLPWVTSAARELQALRDNAEVDYNEVRLLLGEHDEVEVSVRRQLIDHELDERRHQQLIRALLGGGRNAEATEAYLAACRALGTPGPQLRDLGAQLGRRGPATAGARRRPVASTSRAGGWVLLDARLHTEPSLPEPPMGTAVLTIEQAGGEAHPAGADRVAAVFPGSEAAARAAIELASDPRLRCRVGLHAGATVPVGDHLLGPGPARCRLLSDAAHPGQVLVSESARAAGWEGGELVAHGPQRFEDLLDPEDTYELPVSGAPREPRLPRTLSRHPHHLPVQANRFVGRAREIDELSRLLGRRELVTLTGPGGCGKTRLALQLAAHSAAAFADGAWFAGLADVPPGADAEAVATVVAGAVGARQVAGEDAADALRRHLSDRSVLLVLDNCEHVVGACGELVAELRAHAPGTCVIATSIQPLGIDGERVRDVPPMATEGDAEHELPDAVELLLERAGALPSADWRDAAFVREATEVCRLLDGLPLAIELAAGQVAQRGLAGLSTEIGAMLEGNGRLASLSSSDPTRNPRHLTVEATIAWGHGLLGARQQQVLRRLAVFRGSFGLDEARAVVCGPDEPDDVVDVVWSLVHRSMIASQPPLDGAPRLRLRLPIRAFAQERLAEAGESAEVRSRHTAVYRDLAMRRAPALFGADEDATLRALEADHDNFRAALAHLIEERRAEEALRLVGALWWLWFSHGHFEEGGVWVDAALALDDTPSQPVVRALRVASHLSWWRGAHEETAGYNARLEATAGAINDTWGLAWAPMGDAAVLMFGQPELALERLEQSRSCFASIGCTWEAGYALMLTGAAQWFAGDVPAARTGYAEAAEIFARLQHGSVLASARRGEGLMTALTGDPERGEALCHDALAFTESIGDRGGSAQALNFLAAIARLTGDFDLMAERHAAALVYAREVGELWATCSALDGIATVARAAGKAMLAAQLLACSGAIAEQAGFGPSLSEREMREAEIAALRDAMTQHGFADAWRRGGEMSIADAVASALAFTRAYAA